MTNPHPSTKQYPAEMRERAVRLAAEAIEEKNGDRYGVITRIARQLTKIGGFRA